MREQIHKLLLGLLWDSILEKDETDLSYQRRNMARMIEEPLYIIPKLEDEELEIAYKDIRADFELSKMLEKDPLKVRIYDQVVRQLTKIIMGGVL